MDPAIFDKNKSAYKLKNFGPLYYLNLDEQPERRQCKNSPGVHSGGSGQWSIGAPTKG